MLFSMAKTIIKSTFKKPVTVDFPVKPRVPYALSRGHISIDFDECIYCGICERRCPSKAISTNKSEKLWDIDHFKCVQCNCCVEVCPKKCLNMDTAPPACKYKNFQ